MCASKVEYVMRKINKEKLNQEKTENYLKIITSTLRR